MIFSNFREKKIGFLGILGPPYCGIGATIRIGREMLGLLYAGFFNNIKLFQYNIKMLYNSKSHHERIFL